MMPCRGIHVLLLAGLCLAGANGAMAADPIAVTHAWIQEGPPGLTVLAGYMEIENRSDQALHIVRIESSIAERIEVHQTLIERNTATMKRVPELILPPHSRLAFNPGDYHMMIFGVENPVHAGDRVELKLHLAGGTVVAVTAEVRKQEQ